MVMNYPKILASSYRSLVKTKDRQMLYGRRIANWVAIILKRSFFIVICLTNDSVYAEKSVRFETPSEGKIDQLRTRKTGAAVNFLHNYSGAMDLGEQRLVRLKFLEGYSSGTMIINLLPQDGLVLEPVTPSYEFPIDSTEDINLDVVLSGEIEGKYYLTIFVSVMGEDELPISRVFALPVFIGNVTTSKNSERAKIDSDSEIILVPVTEKTRS
jgi:hypothetical protein